MGQRAWYRFEAKADTPGVAHLYVYDAIGKSFWDDDTVTAKKFIDDLNALGEDVATIHVHVNSPGGDVFDAVAIANALKQHKASIEMSIEGLAASAATLITCAGDTIRIGDNALIMVHNPWTFAFGEAEDLRKSAELLDKVRDSIVATYRWVSELSVEEIGALMDAETWMDAEEAVKNGFATEVVTGLKAAASIDPRCVAKLTKVPEKYQARVAALTTPPASPPPAPVAADPAVILQECTAAGVIELAEGLVKAKATLDEARPRIAVAREIRGLCVLAKLPELAAGYIAAGTPVATVKDHLTTFTAKRGGAEIDASLTPAGGAKPVLNTTAIYAERNQQLASTKGA
jgi:ATP-dependent protease ClpP protease subunit